jgi:hypothetical protein
VINVEEAEWRMQKKKKQSEDICYRKYYPSLCKTHAWFTCSVGKNTSILWKQWQLDG